MLQWFKRRSDAQRTAGELYGNVVAAARQPEFYSRYGVADTPEGRFELVALHLFLALEALKSQGGDTNDIARRTLETFVVDMDDCMREMGVGDLTVPKKVKRAAAGFYERAGDYRAALAKDDAGLSDALIKHVFSGTPPASGAPALAGYVREAARGLASKPPQAMFKAH
jgi:cytochrome b pre-mRNA-processing protein 3